MKMVVAIMHGDDAGTSIEALADKGIPTTRLDSRGGFLQKGNTTLLCGCSEEQVEGVMEILRNRSKSRTECLLRTSPLSASRPGPTTLTRARPSPPAG